MHDNKRELLKLLKQYHKKTNRTKQKEVGIILCLGNQFY
jgi:hypothetical protein